MFCYSKPSLRCLILCIAYHTLIHNNTCFSDAWLQPKGHGMFIPSFDVSNFAQTDVNTGGVTDKYITRYQYGLYTEYGIHEEWTIGAKAILMQNVLTDHNAIIGKSLDANFGLDFAEILLRRKIITTDRIAIALVGTFKTPSMYSSSKMYEFQSYNDAYELKLEFGYNFADNHNYNMQIYNAYTDFLVTSFAYRYNRGYNFNESRFEVVYGKFALPSLLVMARLQKFTYLYNQDVPVFNNGKFDFSTFALFGSSGFAKWTLSAATRLIKGVTLELGVYQSINDNIINVNAKNINMYGCFCNLWFEW